MRLFSDSEPAANATRCSGSVFTVTGDSVIAVCHAEPRRSGNNDGAPTAATSRVRKDEKTIATGSGSTGNAGETEAA